MSFDLRTARINRGHGLRGLARELNMHEQTIRRIELGLPVRPESAKPVADYFEISVSELLGLEDVAA